jgi:Ni/Fe-hydrogenase subunit HybB-like protein
MAGLSLGILAYKAACRLRGAAEDQRVAPGLGLGLFWVAALYAALKLGELLWANEWSLLLDGSYGLFWGIEVVVGVLLPLVLLARRAWRQDARVQIAAPLLVLAGVLLNRFNATLFGQVLPPGSSAYTPHILEWMSTIGILAIAALGWIISVRWIVRDEEHDH